MNTSSLKIGEFQGSISILEVILASSVALAAVPFLRLCQKLVRPFFSSLRALPGPKAGYFSGSLKERLKFDNGVWYEQMIQIYGPVFAYKEAMGARTLFTTDLKALNHILGDETIYHRRPLTRGIFDTFFNQGLLGVSGAAHKRQRKIMNPCFSSGHIREMTELIMGISLKLRELLKSKLPEAIDASNSGVEVNMVDYLSRATLDTIGLAGFNYSFNALDSGYQASKFFSSLTSLLRIATGLRFSPGGLIVQWLNGFIPSPLSAVILKFVPLDRKFQELEDAQQKITQILYQVLEEGKNNLGLDQKETRTTASTFNYKEKIGHGKDILSVILRANATISADGVLGLSDIELAHQIGSFLLAGHDTTANATSWALASLATYPKMQTRLRNELLSLHVDDPAADQLNSLTYLDNIIRESLRFHCIVSFMERVASQDDIIPVEIPYKDHHGHERDYIPISKGDAIQLPIITINHSKAIWGEDAEEFKWNSPPKACYSIPGTWGNQLSFGGGARGCIGFKFAIHEMKILLFTLIKAFEFEMVLPMDAFDKSTQTLNKPALKSDPLLKAQLPMIVRLAPTEIISID